MDFFHQKIEYMFGSAAFKFGYSHTGTSSYHKHWHNCIELTYGFDNNYQVHAGNETFNLTNNDILIIPGRVMHDFNMSNQKGRLYFLQFKLSPLSTNCDDVKSMSINDILHIEKNTIQNLHSAVVEHVESVIHEASESKVGCESQIFSDLYGIHSAIERYYPVSNKFLTNKESDYHLDFITEVLQYISENYQNDISVESVAKSFGFNSKYFGRLFFKYMGVYFNDYLNEVRIRRVMEELGPDTVDITSIAYNCGFKSSATFYRTFNKINSCSPKEFISKFSL